MDNVWLNFALEIGLFSLLGVLYYFYQKRKIIRYEENKTPLVMTYLLNRCLEEKTDSPQPKLDAVIEALDDFVNNKSKSAPTALLKTFSESPECSQDLKKEIIEGLEEIQTP